jgi:two-component system sensor histidine kinase RegB
MARSSLSVPSILRGWGGSTAKAADGDRHGRQGWQAGLLNTDSVTADTGQLWGWALAQRGLRLRLLVLLRWVSIAGETIAVLWVGPVLHFHLPILACLLVIASAAAVNLFVYLRLPGGRLATGREAVLQLGIDLVQLSALLMLTGGLDNPFWILLLAPVVVAAATLNSRHAMAVGALALVLVAGLSLWSLPLPWFSAPIHLPPLYGFANAIAATVGIVYTSIYAWQAQAETQRMEVALAATQSVLAREQRLSALGGLAAAAAHELGTPLATIQVVTKEMSRTLAPGTQIAEDVDLLIQQAERCREILRRLSRSPDAADAHHSRMGLSQLLEEVADSHRDGLGVIVNVEVACAPGAAILEIGRRAEVLHGLSAFVENAVDFAESSVEMSAYYDERILTISVQDDGPGFAPDVMGKLGEPYVTTRSQGEGSRTGHLGMGLGFFIAKTLLERTGAQVDFRNAPSGGAVITATWPRARIEALELD